MKDAIVISIVTVALICGACTAIVGGAMGIAVSAAFLHLAVD